MKKPFLLFVFALVLGAFQWAFAAPLKNIPVRITQPDGQVIECFASGDEFYNYLHDANGFTIVKGEGGYYCYAIHDSKGEVVASTYRVDVLLKLAAAREKGLRAAVVKAVWHVD